MYPNPIVISGEINCNTLSSFSEAFIDKIKRPNLKEITVILNSHGGDLYAGYAIHDLIRTAPQKITTIGAGQVMSAATIIFCAGDERLSFKNTSFMIHSHSSTLDGKITDIRNDISHDTYLYNQLKKFYCSNMSITTKEIEVILSKDTYLTPNQALKLGLVDRII